MCHYCGSKSTKSCSSMDKQENDNGKRLNGMDSVQSCQFCGEMKDKNLTSHGVASISPTISMQSSERSVSSCSMISLAHLCPRICLICFFALHINAGCCY